MVEHYPDLKVIAERQLTQRIADNFEGEHEHFCELTAKDCMKYVNCFEIQAMAIEQGLSSDQASIKNSYQYLTERLSEHLREYYLPQLIELMGQMIMEAKVLLTLKAYKEEWRRELDDIQKLDETNSEKDN